MYEKIFKVAPENLFSDPNYYMLQYHIKDAPFTVNIALGNNVRRTHTEDSGYRRVDLAGRRFSSGGSTDEGGSEGSCPQGVALVTETE